METLLNINMMLASGTANADYDLAKLLYAIFNVIFGLGIVVCVIFLVINGMKYAKTRDEDEHRTAKDNIKHTLIGLGIVVLAVPIANLLIHFLTKNV